MVGLAAFRIALGVAAWAAPRRTATAFGVPDEAVSPQLEYMNRVFGVRAVTLGIGYLAASGEARRLWHRLWLLCDVADTAMGAAMSASGRLDPAMAGPALAITAAATAVDVAAMAAGAE